MSSYKSDQDVMFQNLEEKARLLRQAETARRTEFLSAVLADKDLRAVVKTMPIENLKGLIDLAVSEDEE